MWFVSLARQNKRSRYLPSYSQTDQVPALPSRCKYQTTVTPEARDGWRPRGVRGPSKQSCTNEKRRRKRIFFRRSKSRFLIWGPPQAKKSWVRAAYRERCFVPRCILPSAPPPAQRWEPLYSFPLFLSVSSISTTNLFFFLLGSGTEGDSSRLNHVCLDHTPCSLTRIPHGEFFGDGSCALFLHRPCAHRLLPSLHLLAFPLLFFR